MACVRQVAAQLAAGVVERLVERTTCGLQALGEHVDRDVVQRERDEHAPLVRGQRLVDPGLDLPEQLPLLRRRVGAACRAGEAAERLVLERQLATLPGAPTNLDRRLVQRELVRPGREAARAAE